MEVMKVNIDAHFILYYLYLHPLTLQEETFGPVVGIMKVSFSIGTTETIFLIVN